MKKDRLTEVEERLTFLEAKLKALGVLPEPEPRNLDQEVDRLLETVCQDLKGLAMQMQFTGTSGYRQAVLHIAAKVEKLGFLRQEILNG